jgi:hypothetical protein
VHVNAFRGLDRLLIASGTPKPQPSVYCAINDLADSDVGGCSHLFTLDILAGDFQVQSFSLRAFRSPAESRPINPVLSFW